jgi:hypothetical protein
MDEILIVPDIHGRNFGETAPDYKGTYLLKNNEIIKYTDL